MLGASPHNYLVILTSTITVPHWALLQFKKPLHFFLGPENDFVVFHFHVQTIMCLPYLWGEINLQGQ